MRLLGRRARGFPSFGGPVFPSFGGPVFPSLGGPVFPSFGGELLSLGGAGSPALGGPGSPRAGPVPPENRHGLATLPTRSARFSRAFSR
jgi:hypothetical protein